MKIIYQIGIIFALCWVSEIVEALLPFSFPASVIGMALLLVVGGALYISRRSGKAPVALPVYGNYSLPASHWAELSDTAMQKSVWNDEFPLSVQQSVAASYRTKLGNLY